MRKLVPVFGLWTAFATGAGAQWMEEIRPFGGGAIALGASGFARPPITNPVGAAYCYLPAGSLLIGVHGAGTFAEREGSRARYLLATLGYARTRAVGWQAYPFVGAGASVHRTEPGADHEGLAASVGLGFDGLLGGARLGTLVGARVGYIARSLDDDESMAFAVVGLGIGGRWSRRGGGTDVIAALPR